MSSHFQQLLFTVDLTTMPLDSDNDINILFPQHGKNGRFFPFLNVQIKTFSPTGGDATNDVDMRAFGTRWYGDLSMNANNKLYFGRLNIAILAPTDVRDIYSGSFIGQIFTDPYFLMPVSSTGAYDDSRDRINSNDVFLNLQNAATPANAHDAGYFEVLLTAFG